MATDTDADAEPNRGSISRVSRITSELRSLHGVKSVGPCGDGVVRVVAYDDYPILSNVQTVCAWFQAGFSVNSAKRKDGNIVVRFTVDGY